MDGAGWMIKMDAMTFAIRLREAREAARLTQRQLAEACGITDKAVSAWEQGNVDTILADNLYAVADRLGVDPRWLLTGQDGPTDVATAITEIARALADLPVEQQEAVRSLIETLRR